MATTNGNRVDDANERGDTATWRVKAGLAQMLKGGVIMDVVTAGPRAHRRGGGRGGRDGP